MEKIWYILIDGKSEGPFSSRQLVKDPRVGLETLVWKEGMDNWTPLKRIRELRRLFEAKSQNEEEAAPFIRPENDEIALDYGKDPQFQLLLLLLAIVLTLYVFYQFYWLP